MEKTAQESAREAKLARQRAEELKRELAMAAPEIAVFKYHFETAQEGLNRLLGALLKVKERDEAQAEKLRAAIVAVLDGFRKKL